jgi:hypothetical protein
MPVALSNCLWMFCAFLGIARPWNDSMPMRDVLEIAANALRRRARRRSPAFSAPRRDNSRTKRGGPLKVSSVALAAIGRLGPDGIAPSLTQRMRRSGRGGAPAGLAPTRAIR